MSELKAVHAFDVYESYTKTGDDEAAKVYLKSEVDKVIAELKNENERMKKQSSCKFSDDCLRVRQLKRGLRRQKYKRCLAMTETCKARYDEENAKVNGCGASWEYISKYISKEMKYWERWRKRWLEIANKFKDKET